MRVRRVFTCFRLNHENLSAVTVALNVCDPERPASGSADNYGGCLATEHLERIKPCKRH